MTDDFYRDEALSGRTKVEAVVETLDVLAFHHTGPFWPVPAGEFGVRNLGQLAPGIRDES